MADDSDAVDDDRSGSVRGPTEIDVTLSLGPRVWLEAAFAPQYERDEDFWGDERCGFCDSRETGTSRWTPLRPSKPARAR